MTHRTVIALGGILIAAIACQAKRPGVETAPLDPRSPPFVGRVMQTHGQVISIDEDVVGNKRRADVLLVPSTEIIARGGQLVSAQQLRPGVRVTVWFTGNATQSGSGLVRATALKVQIDQ